MNLNDHDAAFLKEIISFTAKMSQYSSVSDNGRREVVMEILEAVGNGHRKIAELALKEILHEENLKIQRKVMKGHGSELTNVDDPRILGLRVRMDQYAERIQVLEGLVHRLIEARSDSDDKAEDR